jgi:two-component system response regulator DesR
VIRILLGHNGALLRGALAALISAEPDLEVVAQLARTGDVPAAIARERPQVAILDYLLPGNATVSELCRTLPDCAVLVVLDPQLSAGAGRSLAQLAPRVGLIGTEASPAELVYGVRQLARGEPVLDPALAVAALTAGDNPLTERECEVLRLVVEGAPAKEIAKKLELNVGTVRNYLSRILAKTGAPTHVDAVRIAQEAGWI